MRDRLRERRLRVPRFSSSAPARCAIAAAASIGVSLTACHPQPTRPPATTPAIVHTRAPTPGADHGAERILSAQLSALGEFPGAEDVLWLTFATDLAPSSVLADRFVVMLPAGRRVVPSAASLGPADEHDENRSVLLWGEFRHEGRAPEHVRVIGPVYGEDGTAFEGAELDVEDAERPDRPVLARVRPEASCPDGTVVQTFWSDALRTAPAPNHDDAATGAEALDGAETEEVAEPAGVADPDAALASVRVYGMGGESVAVEAIVDHVGTAPGVETATAAFDDNVVGFCVPERATPTEVAFEAGAFVDARGRPTRQSRIAVEPRSEEPR